MKLHTILPLVAALAVSAPVRAKSKAADPFEGTMTMQMTHAGRDMNTTYSVKGPNVRVEMPAVGPHAGGVIIMNTAAETMIMLMPAQQMYIEMPMRQPPTAKTPKGKVVKTGKHEKILGYDAEEWRIETDQGTVDSWIAKGVGIAPGMLAGPMSRGPRLPGEDEMLKEGGFPLRSIFSDAEGHESVRMTVTAIERKALSDALFKPPEGWKKFDRGAGMPGSGSAVGGHAGHE